MIKNAKYIICGDNKEPRHTFDKWKELRDVKDQPNLGIILEQPYLIVDIDDPFEFEAVYKIIQRLHIKTKVLKTSRGGHFWFRTPIPVKNVVHQKTPLSVTIDIKCWGKNTMEIVKRNGEWREWLQEDDTVDELPKWLRPTPLITHSFYGMDDGDGRNDALFRSIYPLIKLGFKKEEVKELFYLINEYMFTTPLNYNEIDAMIDNNEVFNSKQYNFYDGKTFLHSEFADYMIDKYHIKYYGGNIYIYDGRIYVCDEDLIQAKMVDVLPALKKNNITETMLNIKLKVYQQPAVLDTHYINLSNGLFDIDNMTLLPHTPDIFTINKIDICYDKNAKCDDIDKLLSSICCKKQPLINLLSQMLGYILLPSCEYQKAFILLGNGSNGKSVFLETIRQMFGDCNCSSLALEDLGNEYKPSEIVGALVNIGDDSGHSLLENTAVFKKLVTGDSMTFNRKYGQPFKFCNTAKLIFAANSLPPTTDKSDGFFRRCIIIPFDAVFKPGVEGYDPGIIHKVTTPTAKSYLFNIAISGLKKLLEKSYFDESDETKTLLNTYMINNNSVASWYAGVTQVSSNEIEAYGAYVKWCTTNNYKPCNIGKFRLEFMKVKKGI